MATASGGTITRCLDALKRGDPDAIQQVWERYFERLVRLARRKLQAVPRAAADEEDVALSAFESFCAAARQGRFPRLVDREDLWRILMTLTARKAADLAQRERRLRRGGGRVRTAADLAGTDPSGDADLLELIADPAPSAAIAAQVAEECRRLMGLLRDDTLRQVALDRLAGYTDTEIAARLGCSRPTVQRKLVVIRNAWTREADT